MISIVFEVYKALLQKGMALEFAPSFQGDKMLVPLAKRNFFLETTWSFFFATLKINMEPKNHPIEK